MTFPVASRFFANGFAFWLGSLAMSYAVRLLANSHALRTVKHFATFVWALNFTFRFLAFDVADGIPRLSTGGMTPRRFTNGVANCWTMGVVALPRTLWVASARVLHECANGESNY